MLKSRCSFYLSLLPYLVLLAIVLPKLLGLGMFVDGVIYAAIGRNLAKGVGSFWDPVYTSYLYYPFHEHPPLAFGLQALLFRWVGDSLWVERFYTLALGFCHLVLLRALWRHTVGEHRWAWLPCLLWVGTPIVFWTVANNELENTLVVFLLSSTLCTVIGCRSVCATKALYGGGLAGLFLFLGFLTKGVFALFPLVFPMIFFVLLPKKNTKNILWNQCGTLFVFGLGCLFLYFYPPAHQAFSVYLYKQVFLSMIGRREVDYPHLAAMYMLGEQIILPLGLCGFVFLVAKLLVRRSGLILGRLRLSQGYVFSFLAMAFCGFLPLLLSSKNHGWYLMISLPFFSLFLAAIFLPSYKQLFAILYQYGRVLEKSLLLLCISLTVVLVSLSWIHVGKVLKNQEYYDDFVSQGPMPMRSTQVSFCPRSLVFGSEGWMVAANLERDYEIQLVPWKTDRYVLVSLSAEGEPCFVSPTCQPIFPPKPKRFVLFACKK